MSDARDRRTHIVSFRVTPSEAAWIDAAASAMPTRRTRADWCRAAALHIARAKVSAPPPPKRNPARRLPRADVRLLAATLAALGKIGSNVNQMARAANSAGRLPAEGVLRTLSDELRAAVADIRRALEGDGDGDQG